MSWQLLIEKRVGRQIDRLPANVHKAALLLLRELEILGPVRGNWPNYGKLTPTRHHCHLKKGRPTYVAVWEVIGNQARLIEVSYVGTHEKAPY